MVNGRVDRALGPPLLGALMRRPWEAIQRVMLEEVHRAGFTDVTRAHLHVLRWPGPQGRRPSEMALELGMSKQALNYLLRQLEDGGYLERHTGEGDSRARTIELTPRGVELAKVLRRAVTKVQRGLERELGADDVARLLELLGRVHDSTLVNEVLAAP